MAKNSFPLKRWQFSARVLTPSVIWLFFALAMVTGFVLWSSANVDRTSLERQTELVQAVAGQELARIPRTQESVTLWDEAIANTAVAFDKEWVDNNLGVWLYEYYGFNSVVILNEADEPIYTMSDGTAPAPELFAAERARFAELVAALRAQLRQGAVAAYLEGTIAEFPQVVDILTIAGRPAIVSVVPIADDTATIVQAPGTEFVHLSVVYLDKRIAADLARLNLFKDAAFTSEPNPSPDFASYPLRSASGDVVTYFEWRRDKPGTVILLQTAPALVAAFLIASLLVLLLINRLWRSAHDLESARLSAEHQATHDPLTGLPNRADFEHRLADAIAACIRDGTQVALLMIDLDRFKRINDTLGHYAGDELIRAVGQRLQQLCEGRALLAHLGGDEFAIIYAGAAATGTATELARAVIEAIAMPFVVSSSEAFVGASIGIAIAGGDEADRTELSRKADIALHAAKSTGRNRAVFYEQSMNEELQSRRQIEAELREALRDGGQLSVAFQPLYSSVTHKIIGAEALTRWNSPRLGELSPAHFIPIAESSGLIETLGEFVLRESCKLGAHWPGYVFAVNVSPAQLRNPKFPGRVFDILRETGMRAADLELEITESILLEEERTAAAALRQFRAAGIRISLDDFGTGYSSLNYLKRYPVDRIKIDRSFVGQIARNSVSSAIVQAMVTLAHALGIRVTAEGVETHEQMELLTRMGSNALQGFLLSPPTTPRLLADMLRGQGAPADDTEPVAAQTPEPAALH